MLRPLCLLSLLAAPAFAQESSIVPFIDSLGSRPCEDSDFTCITMMVPRDHFANDPESTLPITFAISLATDPGAGTLIYVTGGPGSSGLLSAQDYVDALDPDLVARTNIVFFEQRGVGEAHGFACVDAMSIYDATDLPVDDPETAIAAARTFATDCIAETENTDLLGVVNTDQAIRDVEVFRQAIGKPKLWLYGESYGTQFVQSYATAFPKAVNGVIVDGVVDLNLGFAAFYASYTAASENILQRLFAECEAISACRTDMNGSAQEVYDKLAKSLRNGPVMVPFPMGTGVTQERALTATMLETSAFYAIYGPGGRATFLRALAAVSQGDLVPLMRLGYSDLGLDSETLLGEYDPSYSPASYYAINCSDYLEAEGDAETLAQAIMADAAAYAASNPRLLRTYFSERLGCAFWPHDGTLARPEPFAGGDYPTLVLNGDTDPITPVTQAYSVFDNVQNGYMVVTKGGPHVTFGWGRACPDQIVADLILRREPPLARLQQCEIPLVDGYVPLTLTDAPSQADPLAIARAVETEMLELPEFQNWSTVGSIDVGCDHGGVVSQSETDGGYAYDFDACAMWPGLVINGTGVEVWDDDGLKSLTLDLQIDGPKSGEISFVTSPWTESWSISGQFDGQPIATPRLMP